MATKKTTVDSEESKPVVKSPADIRKKLVSITSSVNEKLKKNLNLDRDVVSILGDRRDLLEKSKMSTGNPSLDRILGGGITLGVPIEISGPPGIGKAQPIWCKVLTPSGFKFIDDLEIGDYVVTPSGETTYITGVFPQGEKMTYKVTFDDNSHTYCCKEHLWKVKYSPKLGPPQSSWEVMSLENLYKRKYIDYCVPAIASLTFTSKYSVEDTEANFSNLSKKYNNCETITPEDIYKFLTSSEDVRKKVLNLFFDWDLEFYAKDQILANSIANIGRSLGKFITVTEQAKNSYLVELSTDNYRPKRIQSIEQYKTEECKCISLASPKNDRLYITDNFIPTHNTTSALMIAKEFIKKQQFVLFINVEQQALPLDQFESAGIKGDDFDYIIEVPAFGSGENLFDVIKEFLIDPKTNSPYKMISCIVIDSIAALAPAGEIKSIENNGFGGDTVGQHARMIGKFLRQMCGTGAIASDGTMILINQLREKISTGGGRGGGKSSTGGNAPKYFAKLILELSEDYDMTQKYVNKNTGEKLGQGVNVFVRKNNTGIPGRRSSYAYVYGEGLDIKTPIIEEAIETGIIIKESAVMWEIPTPSGPERIKGVETMKTRLREDDAVFEHVKALVESKRNEVVEETEDTTPENLLENLLNIEED